MKYLEGAIKFLIKNWIIAVPLFVLTAIPALISGIGSSMAQLGSLWTNFSDPYSLDASKFMSIVPGLMVAMFGGGVAILFQFVAMPLTYGLVNKGIETGSASLNDIGQSISQNFVKYLLYFVGTLVVSLVCGIAVTIIVLICILLISVLKAVGILLTVIIVLALIAAGVVIAVLLSMWFSSMVADGLDVIAAAKKSIEVARANFWTIVGIAILVGLAGAIAGGILGILGFIPVIGPIIASVVPTAVSIIMITFYLMLYRDKTGKINAV
jgi:hypothetical protein